MRRISLFRSNPFRENAARVVLLTLLLAPVAPALRGQAARENARSLMQFVQEGKRNGVNDDDLKQNAVKAGWEPHTVDVVLSIVNSATTSHTAMAVTSGNAMPEGYRIGAGDVIQIIVWKELDASVPDTVVRADGKISMPLIKEVQIAGLTPTEAEQILTEKLSQFIHNADVTVVPKQINSKKIYLVGAVRREGPIPIRSAMTVLQAILEAGGLNEYAKPKKIYVLRKQGAKQTRLPFDYSAVIKGEQQQQNVLVEPDDTIVVPH